MEQLRKGHKKTEVGVIPNDWDNIPISKACKLINGRGFKPHEWRKQGLPIIRIQNLNGSEDYNYFEGKYDNKIEVTHKQLLFAWSGSRGTSFGPHIWNKGLGLLNYHTWKIVINEQAVEPSFFYHALKKLTKYIEDKAHGASALVHVQKWEMEKFQFPLPKDSTEQKAIADALSDVDALIANLEKLIAKKKAIKQGAMQQLLTPKKDWVIKRVSEIAEVGRGRVISHKEIDESNDKSFPVYSSQTSNDGIMGYLGTYDFDGEYVTWTTDGVNAGTVFYRSGKFNCTNVCGTLKLKRDNPKFIAVYLNTITSMYVSKNLANPKLMNDVMKKIEVCIPKDISEQNEIAEIILSFENEISVFEKRLLKYKELKQGMMQELLTGKTRLV